MATERPTAATAAPDASIQFDPIDGVIVALLILIAANFNPQNHHWPGWIDLSQVALWIFVGILFSGPVVLWKQRWLGGRTIPWDLGEHLWFWIPSSWLAMMALSLILPGSPLLLAMAIIGGPLIVLLATIGGCCAVFVSLAAAMKGRGRWTSGCGSALSIATGVYAIVYMIRNPLVI